MNLENRVDKSIAACFILSQKLFVKNLLITADFQLIDPVRTKQKQARHEVFTWSASHFINMNTSNETDIYLSNDAEGTIDTPGSVNGKTALKAYLKLLPCSLKSNGVPICQLQRMVPEHLVWPRIMSATHFMTDQQTLEFANKEFVI